MNEAEIQVVALHEAKPNKMFTEWQTRNVRFLRYRFPVECAECGRRSKSHWTVLYSFEAQSLGMFVPVRSGKVHPPLAPVCGTHLLSPAPSPPLPPRRRKKKVNIAACGGV